MKREGRRVGSRAVKRKKEKFLSVSFFAMLIFVKSSFVECFGLLFFLLSILLLFLLRWRRSKIHDESDSFNMEEEGREKKGGGGGHPSTHGPLFTSGFCVCGRQAFSPLLHPSSFRIYGR